MSRSLLNVLAWNLQIAIVVAAAASGSALLRVDAAGARYVWWRFVLVFCLALPLLQPWPGETNANPPAATYQSSSAATILAAGAPVARTGHPRSDGRSESAASILAIALAIGAALRLGWVAAGLWRLRRLRRVTACGGASELSRELQVLMHVSADVRWSDSVRQPVTFGLTRPIVLLPTALSALPEDVQRAVLTHELWHVRRHDWAWVLLEEALRSALWFNPAFWSLISRVQSCREELVDDLTVLATNSRRSYLEALLAFADEPRTFPAASFAERRHLFTRMLLVSKEAGMSSTRVVGSCAATLLGVAMAGSYGAAGFPLSGPAVLAQTAGQLPLRDLQHNEPRPATDGEVRLQEALAAGHGDPQMWLELAGLQERRGAIALAETSLLQMRQVQPGSTRSYHALAGLYGRTGQFDRAISVLEEATSLDPSDIKGYQMMVTFLAQRSNDVAAAPSERLSYTRQGIAAADAALALNPAFSEVLVYKSLLLRTQAGLESDVNTRQALLREADTARNQAFAARQASPGQLPNVRTGTGVPLSPQPPLPPLPLSADGSVNPLRVGGGITTPVKIRHVPPVYPPIARTAGVQGVVILETVIDEAGTVSAARVLRSIPLLDQAALEAVRQWQFTPTLLNGVAVPVVMTVTVNFANPE